MMKGCFFGLNGEVANAAIAAVIIKVLVTAMPHRWAQFCGVLG